VRFLAPPAFAEIRLPPGAASRSKRAEVERPTARSGRHYFRLTKSSGLQPVQRAIESVQSSGRELALGWGFWPSLSSRCYRAHLAAEQTIAENVVRFGQAHPETKLIVLLPDDPLIDPREVAEFAAQKSHRRQMILDREPSPNESHSRLLAAHGRPFQVVDRSPGSGRDHGRLASPRLRTGAIGALLFIAPKEIARL